MTTTHVQMSRVALLVSMVAKTMPIGAAAKRCGIPDRVAVEVICQHGGADLAKLARWAEEYERRLRGEGGKAKGAEVIEVVRGVPVKVVREVRVKAPVEVPVERVAEKEVRVPVEVATDYLDHPSPLVSGCAKGIADQYRRLERLVVMYDQVQAEVEQERQQRLAAKELSTGATAAEEVQAEPVKLTRTARRRDSATATPKAHKPWTAKEDAVVMVEGMSASEAGKAIGRTSQAVYSRRAQLRKDAA